MDLNSLAFLLMGRDSHWLSVIVVAVMLIQKWDWITYTYYRIRQFNKTTYDVTGTFYTNIDENYTYGHLGTPMWALIRYINNLVKTDASILTNATTLRFPKNEVFETEDIIIIPDSKSILKLSNNINCKIKIEQDSRESNNPDKKTTNLDSTLITFTLSTIDSFDTITKFMTKIIQEHTQIIAAKNKEATWIVKPIYGKKSDETDVTELQYGRSTVFASSKTFDNLFFDGKEQLIKRLDSFVNRNKYKTLGLPETLGLLLYGDPGTGKTSCIKAIAKYLDMSLIIVPMSQIKTKKRLEELFFSHRIHIPQDKRIYVFEEIDCNGWETIVRDRNLQPIEDSLETTAVTPMKKEGEADGGTEKKKKDDKDTDKLTLGGILEIIDGLVECPGRVIIMTTNHKEHLDSALLRPGRIDMEIEFKKLRHCHIAEIYQKWYEKPLEEYYEFPDYKYSQAEISQLLFKHENDNKGFIRELIEA
jgi:chaperone BCS1